MFNKVILIGNVGKDPVTKEVGGSTVANFSLATNERYKDRNGEMQDRTEWHNIEVWGKTAEFVGKYVSKGRTLMVEGSLHTDVSGEGSAKKYYTKIKAQTVRLVGPRPAEDGESEL